MRKLRDLVFWRDSSPLTLPRISGNGGVAEDAKITISDPSLTKLETYAQVDPDSAHFEIPVISVTPAESLSETAASTDYTEIYIRLLKVGPTVPGTQPKVSLAEIGYPTWVNHEQVAEGRRFVRKHFYSIIFAHVIGLFLLLAIKPIQALLLRTTRKVYQKKSDPPTILIYLKLLLRLKKWYETGFEENLEDLSAVRSLMNRSASNFKKFIPPLSANLQLSERENLSYLALRYDLLKTQNQIGESELRSMESAVKTINPDVPLSQYDLALVQFSFYGLVTLFPTTFGIHGKPREGTKGFIHLWALLGHFLGLQDQFNLALHPEDTKTQEQIWEGIFRLSFKLIDNTTFRLWKSMYLGLRFFFLPFNAVLYFIQDSLFKIFLPKPKVEGSLWIIMSTWAKFSFYLNSFLLGVLVRSCLFRMFLNGMSRALLGVGWFVYVRNETTTVEKTYESTSTLQVKWSQDFGVEFVA